MFYISQLGTLSSSIGLIKTESAFIIRSVETGLGRWMEVAVISVMFILFWLSQTEPVTLRIQE